MEYANSWRDVSDKEVIDFIEAVYALQEKMVPVDCDSDYAVEVRIVDRRKFEPDHFALQPYLNEEITNWDECFEVALRNLSTAQEKLILLVIQRKSSAGKNRRKVEKLVFDFLRFFAKQGAKDG